MPVHHASGRINLNLAKTTIAARATASSVATTVAPVTNWGQKEIRSRLVVGYFDLWMGCLSIIADSADAGVGNKDAFG